MNQRVVTNGKIKALSPLLVFLFLALFVNETKDRVIKNINKWKIDLKTEEKLNRMNWDWSMT